MKRIVELPVPRQCLASKFRPSDSQDVIMVAPRTTGFDCDGIRTYRTCQPLRGRVITPTERTNTWRQANCIALPRTRLFPSDAIIFLQRP
jgi:hypothetical protein